MKTYPMDFFTDEDIKRLRVHLAEKGADALIEKLRKLSFTEEETLILSYTLEISGADALRILRAIKLPP